MDKLGNNRLSVVSIGHQWFYFDYFIIYIQLLWTKYLMCTKELLYFAPKMKTFAVVIKILQTSFVKNSLRRWSTPGRKNLVCSQTKKSVFCVSTVYCCRGVPWLGWYVVYYSLPVEMELLLIHSPDYRVVACFYKHNVCVCECLIHVTRETWKLICVSLRLHCVCWYTQSLSGSPPRYQPPKQCDTTRTTHVYNCSMSTSYRL